MWLLVYSEAVESKLVKLETSHTVIGTSPNGECCLHGGLFNMRRCCPKIFLRLGIEASWV